MFSQALDGKGVSAQYPMAAEDIKALPGDQMGRKGNKETFSPHSDGNVEML